MATKTFKIGEYAKGGVITVEIEKSKISVIGKEWDTSKGFNKSSDQSNAKEFTRSSVEISDNNAYRKLMDLLEDLTTHYYADKIAEWVLSKSNLEKKHFWA